MSDNPLEKAVWKKRFGKSVDRNADAAWIIATATACTADERIFFLKTISARDAWLRNVAERGRERDKDMTVNFLSITIFPLNPIKRERQGRKWRNLNGLHEGSLSLSLSYPEAVEIWNHREGVLDEIVYPIMMLMRAVDDYAISAISHSPTAFSLVRGQCTRRDVRRWYELFLSARYIARFFCVNGGRKIIKFHN